MSFDAHLPGTTAQAWDESGRLTGLAGLDLTGVHCVIVIAAHPDDETLGCGGLMAVASARGLAVSLIVVTDGAASHPHSRTLPPHQLRVVRVRETLAASRHLGEDVSVTFLDFPDGRAHEFRDQILGGLEVELSSVTDDTLVATPWIGDGHSDHEVVGEATLAVLHQHPRVLGYPIWTWHWATPANDAVPWSDAVRLDLDSAAVSQKALAISEYASQIAPLSTEPGDEAVLDPSVLDHFRRTNEVYFRADPSDRVPDDERLERGYFEDLYERFDDPWQFETRWYERRKRLVALASLSRPRYGSVLEIGCSIGLLTEQLAARADRLTATDISASAVESARSRTAHLPQVTVQRLDAADGVPDDRFDLIVVSEVAYYLDPSTLRRVARDIRAHLAADGEVLLCHWRHPVDDYPLTGDRAQEIARRELQLHRVVRHEEVDFILEVLTTSTASVADRDGLT